VACPEIPNDQVPFGHMSKIRFITFAAIGAIAPILAARLT
jgi:hypothetical protein